MSPSARERIAVAAVAAVAVLALVVLWPFGGSDKYVVYAKFTDAGGILTDYNVKIGQVPAGDVKDITLDKQDHAVVKMELDKGAYPIGAGATARVRPVNLLGEKYIDLTPGDVSHPRPSGSTIPVTSTGVPTELDDVLNMLDPDTRGRLRILVNEAGVALGGRGADFNATLDDLPPALDQARKVVAEVASENTALRTLATRGDRVIGAMNGKRDDLNQFVGSAASALDVAASRRAKLAATVQSAPGALRQLRSTLTQLDKTAGDLTPTARQLRAAAPPLADTLKATPAFADDAREALKAADDVSPTLTRLGQKATPTVRALQPTAAHVASFSDNLQTLTNALDGGAALKNVLTFMEGWAGVTGQQDGLGNVFRLRVTANEELVTSVLQRMAPTLLPAKKQTKKSSGKPAVKVPSLPDLLPKPSAKEPQAGKATGAVDDLLKKLVPGPVGGALGKAVTDVGNAVGAVTGGLGKKLAPPTGGGTPRESSGSDASRLLNYLLG
jgi:virulence factor Mce-like protein